MFGTKSTYDEHLKNWCPVYKQALENLRETIDNTIDKK